MDWTSFLVVLSATLVHSTHAYYFTFRGPINYCKEQTQGLFGNCTAQVLVHVNALNSDNVLIPYDYSSFDFCSPNEKTTTNNRDTSQNLGQLLIGEHFKVSTHNITFAEDVVSSRKLCTKTYERSNKDHEAKLMFLRERIHESYMHQWVIDNMPVTWCYSIMESDQPYCTTRFPIGCFITPEGVKQDACYLSRFLGEPGATYIFNHVHLLISYHKGSEQNRFTDGRIVQAQVQLTSCKEFPCTAKSEPLKLPEPSEIDKKEAFNLTYSYTVEFVENEDIQWASRWDYILSSVPQSKYQLIVLIYTIFTVSLMSLFAGLIIYHSLRQGNKQTVLCSGDEDYGWMLVHERPRAALLLSACVGSGLQILCTIFFVLVLACLGILAPPNRGAFVIALLVSYALFGYVAGYSSARIYNTIQGLYWKTNVLMTTFFVPGIAFGVFFVLNLFLWGAGSSAAIPFATLLALLCLWFGVSLSLTFLGSFLAIGFREAIPENLMNRIKNHDRIVRKRNFVNRLGYFILTSVMIGDLPFFCIFVQVLYIFTSLWSNQSYYYNMFGSTMLAFFVLVLTCAESGLIICHNHLQRGDYHWWWRSFFSTGTNAIAFFIFSIHYLIYKTTITGAFSYFLYFGYTFIITFLFFIMTGTIGFLASLLYICKIYSGPMSLLSNPLTQYWSIGNEIVTLPTYMRNFPSKTDHDASVESTKLLCS